MLKNYPNEMDRNTEAQMKEHVMFGGPWRGPLIVSGFGISGMVSLPWIWKRGSDGGGV